MVSVLPLLLLLAVSSTQRLPDIELSDDDTVPAAPGQIVEVGENYLGRRVDVLEVEVLEVRALEVRELDVG